MAYDEKLAKRVRDYFGDHPALEEKKMFGGLCFLVGSHMCVGILGDELMARVGPDAYETALGQPGARAMDFTGKPLKGMVYVAPAALRTQAQLSRWIERCTGFVGSLPPKKPKKPKKTKAKPPPKARSRPA